MTGTPAQAAERRATVVELEYEALLWRSTGIQGEINVLDQAICALKKQKRALRAKADQYDRALCDFIRAHRDEVREIEKQHQDERRAELADAEVQP